MVGSLILRRLFWSHTKIPDMSQAKIIHCKLESTCLIFFTKMIVSYLASPLRGNPHVSTHTMCVLSSYLIFKRKHILRHRLSHYRIIPNTESYPGLNFLYRCAPIFTCWNIFFTISQKLNDENRVNKQNTRILWRYPSAALTTAHSPVSIFQISILSPPPYFCHFSVSIIYQVYLQDLIGIPYILFFLLPCLCHISKVGQWKLGCSGNYYWL